MQEELIAAGIEPMISLHEITMLAASRAPLRVHVSQADGRLL